MGTLLLRPNAAGTNTNITTQFPASGVHYDKIDEVTADEDATYLEEVTPSTNYDTFALPASGLSDLVIDSVTVYVRGKNQAGAGAGRRLDPVVYVNGAVYWEDTGVPTASYANNSQAWAVSPDTAIAWTWAEIDALEVGVRIGTGTGGDWVRCTQVWVVVAYTGEAFPIDPLLRVSGIKRIFFAGIGGEFVYRAELTLGGLSTTYISPISPREAASVVTPTPLPSGSGYSQADYERWLLTLTGPDLARGHFLTYEAWVRWRQAGKIT